MPFPNLFAPGVIGTMAVRNRIVMPAISTKFSTADGEVSRRYLDFLVERARGGVGLIVIENTCVDWPRGKGGVNPVRIDRDRFIPGLAELAEEVHLAGARIATQLQHVGRQTGLRMTEGIQPIAPSPVAGVGQPDVPREMSATDIEEVVELFGEAARRTKQSGFDAVEIHGAHGYLLTQFLSPLLNHRHDEYGGTLENRLRFPLAILRRVRAAVGPRFPILFRISVEEGVPGGLELEEAMVAAPRLAEAGVDALDVTAGLYESPHRIFPTMAMPMGCHVPLAAAMKSVVGIPVIAVGKLNDPSLADRVIASGQADFVAIGRQLLADPEFADKAHAGRIDEIRPCLSCNNGCLGHLPRQWRIRCDVNPALGREGGFRIRPARRPQRIMVVGGGPAGMQCAIDLAARGHQVRLFESRAELGGLLNIGWRPPGKDQVRIFRDYLVRQVARLKVEVELGTIVGVEHVRHDGPDAVVLATGARPGWGDVSVGASSLLAEDVLRGTAVPGRSAIVVGGGSVGAETAEFLAGGGHTVTLVECLPDIAGDLDSASRTHLKMRLADAGVRILTATRVLRVGAGGVEVTKDSGPPRWLDADAVVGALGYVSRRELAEALRDVHPRIFAIGDCVVPRRILEAVHEGAHLARWL